MTGRRRVAICGVGLRTPAGSSPKEVLDAVLEGRSLAAEVPELVARRLPVTFACQVPALDTDTYLPPRQARQLDRASLMALAAASDAVGQTPWRSLAPAHRRGVSVGVGAGGVAATEALVRAHDDRPAQVPAFAVPHVMASSPAAQVGLRFDVQGSTLTYATACASGATAIGEALLKIRSGELDVVLAGGVDAAVTPLVVAAFANLRALSRRNDDPAAACRPFDVDRDGFVLGEGAAFLLLQEWEQAQARGADVLGELLGYGSTSDAFHVVAPRPDGEAAVRCLRAALKDAGVAPGDVGHVNAHGTSTVLNDRAESQAVLQVFGEAGPPLTASKGVLGHALGAAGAVEAVVTLLSARRGLVPPVANFRAAGPDTAAVDVVHGTPRAVPPGPAVSNSFAFGGHNVSLVLAPCG